MGFLLVGNRDADSTIGTISLPFQRGEYERPSSEQTANDRTTQLYNRSPRGASGIVPLSGIVRTTEWDDQGVYIRNKKKKGDAEAFSPFRNIE
jgi:hypothetical protein